MVSLLGRLPAGRALPAPDFRDPQQLPGAHAQSPGQPLQGLRLTLILPRSMLP